MMKRFLPALVPAAALAALALASAACNTYYIPPPPVSIVLNNFQPNLVISSLDTSGNIVPSTLQLSAAVANSPDNAIEYSVGQDGNYVQGGNNILGFVDNQGVYTAPLVVPTPNEVTILAVAHVDPTKQATTTITLLNPTATSTAVTPAVVTQGQNYTFDLTGKNFASGATVQLSGAHVNQATVVSPTEMKVTAQVQSPGLLSLSVINPFPFGPTNVLTINSQPTTSASSSALAVVIGRAGTDNTGQPITASKAFIPEASTQSLAVVNLEAGKQIASVALPNGYAPSMAAANPAHQQVVIASASSNILQVVDANTNTLVQSFAVPVTTPTTVDGTTCLVCGLLVDSSRNLALLDTAAGYFTLNLADGTTSSPIAAPAAANFTYDPATQRIFAPFSNGSGSGMNVIDLGANTVASVVTNNGVPFGTGADTATLDPATLLLTVGDKVSGNYLALNFNNAQTQGATVSVAAAPFTITSSCTGAWTGMGLDFTSHLGWFANQGGCVAMAVLPPGAATGVPGLPSIIRWARIPNAADGLPWTNTPLGQSTSLLVYTGTNGRAYGLALRADGGFLLKMDLTLLQAARPVAGSNDANQVDPANVLVNGLTVPAFTYIPLH